MLWEDTFYLCDSMYSSMVWCLCGFHMDLLFMYCLFTVYSLFMSYYRDDTFFLYEPLYTVYCSMMCRLFAGHIGLLFIHCSFTVYILFMYCLCAVRASIHCVLFYDVPFVCCSYGPTVYILFIYCLYTVLILFTYCLRVVYVLFIDCLCAVMYCLCAVMYCYILFTYCLCVVYLLFMYCL